jgi:4-diphosphocytidyl-2C-methyl-D-erythritol kinase
MSIVKTGSATQLQTGCKLNLCLKILGVRDDGYHELESLFIPLASPCDTLTIQPLDGTGLSLRCDDPSLPIANNTITKAYNAFARHTGFVPGLSVLLQKRIPHGSGLGGGSANAAGLLAYLARLAEHHTGSRPNDSELAELAASIGADVPFFLVNRPAVVRGIGERIEVVPAPLPGWHLVLVCPDVRVSTAWAFSAWDKKNSPKDAGLGLTTHQDVDTTPLVHGLRVENDLCPVVFEQYPELQQGIASLHGLGARAACMSGTGSSLFGLFEDEQTANSAVKALRHKGLTVFHHIL